MSNVNFIINKLSGANGGLKITNIHGDDKVYLNATNKILASRAFKNDISYERELQLTDCVNQTFTTGAFNPIVGALTGGQYSKFTNPTLFCFSYDFTENSNQFKSSHLLFQILKYNGSNGGSIGFSSASYWNHEFGNIPKTSEFSLYAKPISDVGFESVTWKTQIIPIVISSTEINNGYNYTGGSEINTLKNYIEIQSLGAKKIFTHSIENSDSWSQYILEENKLYAIKMKIYNNEECSFIFGGLQKESPGNHFMVNDTYYGRAILEFFWSSSADPRFYYHKNDYFELYELPLVIENYN